MKPAPLGRALPVEKSSVPVEGRAHPVRPARWITPRELPRRRQSPPSREHPFPHRPPSSSRHPIRVGSAWATRTTVAVDDPSGPGQLQDLRRRAAQLAQRARLPRRSPPPRSSPSSRAATPVAATSGIAQPSSLPSGASARAVTTSKRSPAVQVLGPARGTTRTLVEAELVDDLVEEGRPSLQRLDQGQRAGRGGRSPAPVPAAPRPSPGPPRLRLRDASDASARQLSTCRSQSFGASRGPISPRSTPAVASSSTYRSASGRRSRRERPPRRCGRGGRFT